MNKIRIINNEIKDRRFNIINGEILLCPIAELYSITHNVDLNSWGRLINLMRFIENIFAIQPIILIQYLDKKSISLKAIHDIVNPLDTTPLNTLSFELYLTELKKLADVPKGMRSTHQIGDVITFFRCINEYHKILE